MYSNLVGLLSVSVGLGQEWQALRRPSAWCILCSW